MMFLIRGPLEQRMSMLQLDRLLKALLFFMVFIIPVLSEYILWGKVYKYIGKFNGNDGLSIIRIEDYYSFSNTTPYGNHWIFVAVFIIWTAGILIGGFWEYKKEKKLLGILKKHSFERKDEGLEGIRRQLCEEIKIKRKISFFISDLADIPFTTGVFHPIIFLPEKGTNEENLKLVIKHELIHCKKYDCLYRKLLFWICAVYWFNPALRRFTKYFIEINEFACDEWTLEGVKPKERFDYARLLVNMECQTVSFMDAAFLTGHTESYLERRMVHMKTKKNGMKRIALGVTSFVFAMMWSVTAFAASSGAAYLQNIAARNIYQGTEVKINGNIYEEKTDTIELQELEELSSSIQLRQFTEIEKDISAGERISLGYSELSAGDKIALTLEADSAKASFCAGYIDSSGKRTYASTTSGELNQSFKISKSGKYQIFIENTGKTKIHISGAVTII